MKMLAADDWEAWLVLADQLMERGNELGVLLAMECGRHTDPMPPEDDAAIRADLDAQLRDWLYLNGEVVSEREQDALLSHITLSRRYLAIKPFAPPAVAELMAYSTIQLTTGRYGKAPLASELVDACIAAVSVWIGEVFDGVPPPGPTNRTLRQAEAADNYEEVARLPGESEGPWQATSEAYLLTNQWALAHLDGVGLRYYLPAVMCFALRHLLVNHPDDKWLTESLEYTLHPSSGTLRDYQRSRMGGLTPDERAAIAGFCWLTDNDVAEGWAASVSAGPDWLTAFQHGA